MFPSLIKFSPLNFLQDPTGTLGKPDLTRTLKEYKTVHYYHSGKYETRMEKTIDPTKEADQYEGSTEKPVKMKPVSAWSCCRNEDQKSEGCHRFIIDKYKWNFASPGN